VSVEMMYLPPEFENDTNFPDLSGLEGYLDPDSEISN
jgi:hypothetical protein